MQKSNVNFDQALFEKSGLSAAELQELVEIFSLVDVDHGGTISKDELASLMRTMGFKATKDEMDEMMNEIDSKRTGEIDFEGLLQGQITMTALRRVFTDHCDNKISQEDATELIRQVAPQADKDTFDYNQFVNLYFTE
eukprot:jgi/Hompol1/5116/HPOL_004193-RA